MTMNLWIPQHRVIHDWQSRPHDLLSCTSLSVTCHRPFVAQTISPPICFFLYRTFVSSLSACNLPCLYVSSLGGVAPSSFQSQKSQWNLSEYLLHESSFCQSWMLINNWKLAEHKTNTSNWEEDRKQAGDIKLQKHVTIDNSEREREREEVYCISGEIKVNLFSCVLRVALLPTLNIFLTW